MAQVMLEVERRCDDISAIQVDSGDHELSLFFVDELPRLWRLLWKVNEDKICRDSKDDGDDPLHDEDPSPAFLAIDPVHLLELKFCQQL